MILLLLLSLFNFNASALTTQSIIEEARVLAYDPNSTSSDLFSYTQAIHMLNQAQKMLVSDNHCIEQSITFNLVPGTTYYPMPSNYLTINRVTVGYKWIQEMSPAALDGRSRGWEQASGYPTYYFVNFSSRGLVGFAPWPQTATDTDTVKIDYYINANDLLLPTDIPFNGIGELTAYQIALSYYLAGIMDLAGGSQKGPALMAIFNQMAATLKNQCMNRPNYLPSGTATP